MHEREREREMEGRERESVKGETRCTREKKRDGGERGSLKVKRDASVFVLLVGSDVQICSHLLQLQRPKKLALCIMHSM